MTRRLRWQAWMACSVVLCGAVATQAQTASASATTTSISDNATVPRLIRFSGVAHDENGKPLGGVVGITFSFYAEETGGAALWMETQNVRADAGGHYSVLLGAAEPNGLPAELFASGQARWIGVQVEKQAEQARALLVSAPYALKAKDAETLGGLPPSAFVLAAPASASVDRSQSSSSSAATANGGTAKPNASSVTTTGGTANTIPMFTTSTNIQNSILTQTGTTAVNVSGTLNMPALGTATASKGFNSQPHNFVASVFNSSTKKAVPQTFQLQAEPVNNNTKSTASGTLNLLYGSGTAAPGETGLSISNKGVITFAPGQTFPGAGSLTGITTATGSGLTGGGTSGTLTLSLIQSCASKQVLQFNGTAWACSNAGAGTVTSVATGTGLTGGPITTTGTIAINTAVVPQLNAANTFTGNQAVTGNLSATGTVTGGTIASKGAVTALGDVRVDYNDKNTGSFTPGLRFGGPYSTGEGIASARAGGSNQDGLDFYTSSTARMSITNDGRVGINTLPDSNTQLAATTPLDVAFYGISASSGASTIAGLASSTSGAAWGVAGTTESTSANAYGVIGQAAAKSGSAVGVYGYSSSPEGVGVFGQREQESTTGQNLLSARLDVSGIGVWGDGGVQDDSFGRNVGVVGTVDEGVAAFFASNSSFPIPTVIIESLNSNSDPFFAAGNGGSCRVDVNGNLNCTGTKNAIVTVDGGARIVAMSAIESPVNWFEDAGESQLSSGTAVVELDSTFTQTVNTEMKYQVFLTPYGDCKGLYVTKRTASSFEVHELGGGTSNLSFGYRIMAVRRNYETVRFADHTRDMDAIKRMQERMKAPGAKPVNHDPKKKLPLAPPKQASLAQAPGVHR